ncbi:4-(cytidine 5'-diphospho)-2-C-methyl-D-erythritol kinase [Phenylobacterium sp.]|jgi:4-diphosphocytidyl-2-C-methyl-D-erythritol kinase|uniref:4-(cytidine 5'-diphospho)-2-C-methyl-D-erythritol kinase n=1 Tax=Phenylobacterium sp. TaxID=1871053 RepID=UPI0025FA9757|nr:4-(cytidine 5'-diphospho)-2-C-methyl-D-erythritol kinase [Phenylobacterium sp.]MCA3739855.1 4-(cytidine 5'-diphospho)-2-C-methyl-D-erythritol kinase [Phenylobacterium sp.]
MSASAFAPAKVNLYLHVGPPGADGYHPLDSLMVFADVGDEVSISTGPGPALRLTGPFATGLEAGDNLVLLAARQLAQKLGRAEPPPALLLEKRLPVAAGLGGGSADAAATLRLLSRAWASPMSGKDLETLAADLGSDVPACIRSRPVTATGRGEVLAPAPDLPGLPAVLVNPGVACPTGAVYRAFDAAGRFGDLSPPSRPAPNSGVSGVAGWLSGLRNDLEAPAIAVAPVIATVLERLRAAPETLLARLSGSGATGFALCRDAPAATRLAAVLAEEHPAWWVQACRLGAPLAPFV